MSSVVWRQAKSLLWRNCLIVRRDHGGVFLWAFFPVMYMVILTLLNSLIPKDVPFPPEPVSEPLNVPMNATEREAFLPSELVIAYIPSVSLVASRIVSVLADPRACSLCTFKDATILPLENSTALERYVLDETGPLHVAIEFRNLQEDGSLPPTNTAVEIALRFNGSVVPGTNPYILDVDTCRGNITSCATSLYVKAGLLDLESELAHALARELPGSPKLEVKGTTQFFPRESYTPPPTFLKFLGPIFVCLSFWPLVVVMVAYLVTDNEKKLKEGMIVMGLSSSAYMLSWVIVMGVLSFLMNIVQMLILVLGGFLANANMFLVFIMLFLYSFCTMGFCLIISLFFEKPNAAVGLGVVWATTVGVLCIPLTLKQLSGAVYAVCSLLPPIAVALGTGEAFTLEVNGPGLQFSTVWTSASGISFGGILLMLLLDAILFFFIAWYLDNVVSISGSARRPANFLCSRSYWRPRSASTPVGITAPDASSDNAPDVEQALPLLGESGDIEKLPSSARVAVTVSNLSKIYPRPDFLSGSKSTQALSNVNLEMAEGQIFGLLGHNGAGKSTLISILSGSLRPTSGTARINGLDITTDMPAIRSQLGLCPQHNLLVPLLNVKEHLQLYLGLKGGIPEADFDATIDQLLEEFELTEVVTQTADTLSGGQKRKLSVAIALIGNPKIIILDEPTAGMDVHARRKMWTILQKYKADRVIIIASHFLDEIDVLTDRKAILTKGNIRCCGTSLFIKSRFGLGYHLTIDVTEGADGTQSQENVLALARNYVPNASLDSGTRTIRLPQEHAHAFASLFKEIDRQMASLGIRSFSVSMTSLEDVFLRVEHEVAEEDPSRETADAPVLMPSVSYEPASKWAQFEALVYVRFRQVLRQPSVYIIAIVIPIIQQVIGMIIGTINQSGVSGSSTSSNGISLLDADLVTPSKSSSEPLAVAFDSASTWSALVAGKLFSSLPWVRVGDTSGNFAPGFIDGLANHTTLTGVVRLDGSFATDASTNVELFVLPTFVHALPAYWSQVTSASLAALASSTLNQDVTSTMNIILQTLPSTAIPINGTALGSILLLSISLAVLPYTLAVELVREKEKGVRHQMTVMGLDPFIHWMATLVRDLSVYSILGVSTIVLIFAFDVECLNGPAILPVIITIILFLPVSVMLAYLFTFLPLNVEQFTKINLVPVLMVIVPLIVVMVLAGVNSGQLSLQLHYVFMAIDPAYGFAGTISYICEVENAAARRGHTSVSMSDYFSFSTPIPGSMMIMALHWVILSLILAALERQWTCLCCRRRVIIPETSLEDLNEMDSDVVEERVRLQQPTDDLVVAHGLGKVYRVPKKKKKQQQPQVNNCGSSSSQGPGLCEYDNNVVVDDLWFGIERGECFGLLGPNGAR